MAAYTCKFNLELLELPDCEGLLETGKCDYLNVSACLGKSCSFYHASDTREKTYERLRVLDENTQEHISAKYYNGQRPWLDTATKARR